MYQWKERVRFSETGEDGRMTLAAMVNIMQDCSNFHSDSLGIGADHLLSKNRAWMLNSWQIIVDRYPLENEEFTVETRPWKFERFFGQRNFALYDSKGEAFVKANSIWFYIDTRRMRPMRPDPEDVEPYGIDEPLDMPYADKRKIEMPANMKEETPFPVLRSHLDVNHHVNNGQYIRMAAEYFPEDMEVRELRVEYRTAAKKGDWIYPLVGTSEDGWLVTALCQEDHTPYALIAAKCEEK